MQYRSLDDVLADRGLELPEETQATTDALLDALSRRMAPLQGATDNDNKELHRRLLAAHEFVRNLDPARPGGQELVIMPPYMLEKLIDAVSQSNRPVGPSAMARLTESKSIAVTRASKDFTKARTLPLVGVGAVAVFLWTARDTLKVEVPSISAALYGVVSLGIFFACVLALTVAKLAQSRAEGTLRSIFDPDVQGEALRYVLNEGPGIRGHRGPATRCCTRRESRHSLWGRATRGGPTSRPSEIMWSVLHTVDLAGALDDAVPAALDRFVELGVLTVHRTGIEEVWKFADDE